MSTLKEELSTKLTPGSPVDAPAVLYVMHYRQGMNPHPLFTFFNLRTTEMKIVVERAKRHCDLMSYRFISVHPAVIDLDKIEKRQNGDYSS